MLDSIGIIVGRFQVPSLHDGHRALIETVLANHKRVIVFLGVSRSLPNDKYPLSFDMRVHMFEELYSNYNISYFPLQDQKSDFHWSEILDSKIKAAVPDENVVLYGSRMSFIPHYHGKHKTVQLAEVYSNSGSEIRESIKVEQSYLFRQGVIHHIMNRPGILYPTVDIVLVNNSTNTVLLGKKPNQEEWVFPGGFVDVKDSSLEIAARRELKEECGDIETSYPKFIGSLKIDDWRYRNTKDGIITSVFKTNYMYGRVKAGDDLEEVRWFSIDKLNQTIADHHKPIANLFLKGN